MTDRPAMTHAALATTIATALAGSPVPHHLRDGLVRWFGDGILPGGFLQAILANDLRQAVARAAPLNVFALEALVGFLEDHAPPEAWGSRAALLAWTTTPDRLEI